MDIPYLRLAGRTAQRQHHRVVQDQARPGRVFDVAASAQGQHAARPELDRAAGPENELAGPQIGHILRAAGSGVPAGFDGAAKPQ